MTRLIGLDHGSRRIGVAVADEEVGMAFARPAIQRHGGERDVSAVVELARRENADAVVIGLPLHGDGSEGSQAAATRAFGERLSAAGLAVRYCDERLSSWQADQDLAEAGRRHPRRSGARDAAAARVILQQYLDDRHPRDRESEEG